MNLATIALRAVVDALENDEEAARQALATLLAPPPAAPVAQRDPKPEKIPRPAARRRVARPARPAPAASEAAQLVAALVAQVGSLTGAAERWGFAYKSLRSWRDGGPVSPRTLQRLRESAGAIDAPRKPRGPAPPQYGRNAQEADAGDEPAPQADDDEADETEGAEPEAA